MKVSQDMDGKVVLITGAGSGVGLAAALLLAERGAEIVMVCRDQIRGNFMRKAVAEYASGPPALFFADLSSQTQIHILADQIHQSYARIDVLIDNAGAVFAARELNDEGVEKTLAINHLAPFLLTKVLLDLVYAAPAGRIVNVASQTYSGSLDFVNLQSERRYIFFAAYCPSKLCNILFTYEHARRLSGTAMTANCLSSGPTLTHIGDNMRGWPALFPRLLKQVPFISEYPERGARTHVYVASSPHLDGISGLFFLNCRETRTKPITYDAAIAAKLWEISDGLCTRSIYSESVA